MHSIAWWPSVVVLFIATVCDIRTRRIPNWLVLPFLAAGVIFAAMGRGAITVGQSLGGIALAAAVVGVLCWLKGMGMGDLKLFAAIGAWIGPDQLIIALIVAGMAGGVLALIWAACYGAVGRSLDGVGDLMSGWWRRGVKPHETLVIDNPSAIKMPFAPAIAIGTLFSFFTLPG